MTWKHLPFRKIPTYAYGNYTQGQRLWGYKFLPIFCFGAIRLAPDMLESQSRSLKTWIIV